MILLWVLFGAIQANGWMSRSTGLSTTGEAQRRRYDFVSQQKKLWSSNQEKHPSMHSKQTYQIDDTRVLNTEPPFLAIVTEPDACDSDESLRRTVDAIADAVSTNQVTLVSVRVIPPPDVTKNEMQDRIVNFSRRLISLSEEYSFHVVVSSDWVDAAVEAKAHGVHVKESHRSLISHIRHRFNSTCLIGTSTHSVSSAVDAWSEHKPDYLFVGTCYPTASHPGKVDLEGPTLPGQVRRTLDDICGPHNRPIVLAIGGIDVQNCHEPVVTHGADGVATIRAVLQASDPAAKVRIMRSNMQKLS